MFHDKCVSPRQNVRRNIPFIVRRVSGEQAEKLDSLVVHHAVKLFTFFTAKLRGESAKMGVSKIGSSVCRPFFISSKALKAGEDREKSMKPFQMRSTEREGVKGGENCAYVFFMAAL